jgi:hypothetical protein
VLRLRRALLAAVAVTAALSLSSCSGDGTPASAPAPSSAPSERGPESDPCGLLVSAIRYADQVLTPPGQEDLEDFDGNARGRLAYVAGAVTRYGAALPEAARPAAQAVRRVAEGMTSASTPHAQQVASLRKYRAAAADALDACEDEQPAGAG